MGYRIGIDVGGTNTDSVLLDSELNLVYKVKTKTTKDVSQGIDDSLTELLACSKVDPKKISHVMLGTTHCTNAIVERKGLTKIAVIRIAAPASTTIPPLAGWPSDMLGKIGDNGYIVSGGYEYDGRLIADINALEIRTICQELKGNVESIAIAGVFSPVNQQQEKAVATIIREELGEGVYLSLSNEVGSIGLLERENATILNAALKNTIRQVTHTFKENLEAKGIDAQIYFGQNDGTLMTSDYALQYPILTIASGPTNSIRGAAHLTGLDNALVIDVGGTTTDIGVLVNGFPRESSVAVEIGDIRTNFRMPDLLSFGLGGGTIIRQNGDDITVGPDSVGYQLTEKGLIFGGNTFTATDVAISQRKHVIPGAQIKNVDQALATRADEIMMTLVEEAIDRMKTSREPIPVIVVGGGSILISSELKGVSTFHRPDHFDAANAIGAALGEVSGETDKIYTLDSMTYEEIMDDAKDNAFQSAKKAGADPETIKMVNMEDIPLAYLPGNSIHVKIKVAGVLQS